jgi:hypothetical protein
MDYRDLLNREVTLVLDPLVTNETANEFLAKYGGYLDELVVVAKHPSGYTYYNSSIANASKEHNTFFSSYAKLSAEVGMRTYALVNTFTDSVFGNDPQFQTLDPKGRAVTQYVCPTNESFWKYIGAIGAEVARYQLSGIIFTGNRNVRTDTCFCDKCRKSFAQYAGLQEQFTIDEVLQNADLKKMWLEWRSEKMLEGLKFLVDTTWREKRDLDIGLTVDLDPGLGLEKGAYSIFGQKPFEMADLTGHGIPHIYPFTPMLPDIGSDEYQTLIDSLQYTKDIVTKEYSLSLFYWGTIEEREYSLIRQIAEEIKATKTFVYPALPEEFNFWREAHLGLYY